MITPMPEQARLLDHLQRCNSLGLGWVARDDLFHGPGRFELETLTSAVDLGWVNEQETVVCLTGKGALALQASSDGDDHVS